MVLSNITLRGKKPYAQITYYCVHFSIFCFCKHLNFWFHAHFLVPHKNMPTWITKQHFGLKLWSIPFWTHRSGQSRNVDFHNSHNSAAFFENFHKFTDTSEISSMMIIILRIFLLILKLTTPVLKFLKYPKEQIFNNYITLSCLEFADTEEIFL